MSTLAVIVRVRNEDMGLLRLDLQLQKQQLSGITLRKVLVNDNSTDSTRRVADVLEWEVIDLKPGQFTYPHALNKGLEHILGQSEYMMSLSAHSWPVRNDCIERAVAHFEQEPGTGAVYAPVKIDPSAPLWERAKNLWYYAHLPIGPHIIKKVKPGTISNIGAFYRVRALVQAGGFDETMAGGGEDLRMALTLYPRWNLVVDPRCAVYHTHHIRSPRAMLAEKKYWSYVARQAMDGGEVPFDRRKLWYRGNGSWLNH